MTKIGTASWSVHKYHLISTDGGMVYGWVDRSNIDGCVSTGTSGTTNAGTQQIKSNKTSATTGNATGKMYPVYHKVKSGDTVYKLVVQYSYLGKSVGWVISNSPNAFSKPGNATTLKVGAYLLMGYKQ